MTKAEALRAFREVAVSEFSFVPSEDEIEYEFSPEFNKKMEKLIKKSSHGWFSKSGRRFLPLVAMISVLIALIMSASGLREPIASFIEERFNNEIVFSFSGGSHGTIEQKFKMKYIPDGFEQVSHTAYPAEIKTEYVNSENKKSITLYQNLTALSVSAYDYTNGKGTTKTINGSEVFIYRLKNGETSTAAWDCDDSSLICVFNGQFEEDEIIKIVESIE